MGYYEDKLKQQKEKKKKEQLCWTCKRAIPKNGCEWADNFQPVEDWKATPTKLYGGVRKGKRIYTESYHISYCPKYINDNEKI